MHSTAIVEKLNINADCCFKNAFVHPVSEWDLSATCSALVFFVSLIVVVVVIAFLGVKDITWPTTGQSIANKHSTRYYKKICYS